MSDLPSFENILQIPATFDQQVEPEFIDENGHMNIGDYFRLGSWAMWKNTQAAGVDREYVDELQLTLFTAEQHIRYYSELRLGDRFTVHSRILERSARVVHGMSFIVDQETSSLACTLEATLVHVSTATRRTVDISDEVASALDVMIAESDALGWAAPVCGAMGVRRR
ncbi:thioesterase family protein [Aeromicrobium sp.]|uniref:thioesterase family protein n=1 Tax=Aeromicrobium sp. TaxID=1871063 RepID=UPI0019C8A41A|nr:thioesterase family protein [Aeromicrobium sp.]MBC7629877.1 thioesterase family protein [Aeromicrobium sp.]